MDQNHLKHVDSKGSTSSGRDESEMKWCDKQEQLLLNWAEKAAGYRWLHNHARVHYNRQNNRLSYPSIIISQILAWKMGLTCIGFALAMTLQAWEKEMYHLKVVAIAAIINIVANIIFIPKFGVNAAAITAVICEAIVIFLFSYIVIKEILKNS